MNRKRNTRLALVPCVAAVLLLNFPLILVWDRDVTVAGLPLLPVALFGIWAVLIALVALIGEARPVRRRPDGG